MFAFYGAKMNLPKYNNYVSMYKTLSRAAKPSLLRSKYKKR